MQLLLRVLDQIKSENADLVWTTLDVNERNQAVLVLARLIAKAIAEDIPSELIEARDE